jgi:hypothetical protein
LKNTRHPKSGQGKRKLVSTSISHQNQDSGHQDSSLHPRFEIFPVSLKVVHPNTGNADQVAPDRTGTTIEKFSNKSRSNLRFIAMNADPKIQSQFGLTYHSEWPSNGRESKKHLDRWLTYLRRLIPNVGYLWLLEFQKRDAPHYHVFLTVAPDEENRIKLAKKWCQLTSPDDDKALRFHTHANNWIRWEMFTAGYLCKYLDKEAQKCVPDGYSNFGRFWGNSRNLVPEPIRVNLGDIDDQNIDQSTGEIQTGSREMIRWLGRLAEKQTNGYSRFRKRAPRWSYTMLQGSSAYFKIERYISNQRKGGEKPCLKTSIFVDRAVKK